MLHSLFLLGFLAQGAATQPAQPARPAPPPQFVSPEVSADHKITFRLLAPDAGKVSLRAGDIPGLPREGVEFTKGEKGIWEATVGPVPPGAYRYTFSVNGVPAMDPRNPEVSQSNGNAWSMVYVAGSEFMDSNKVPHGAVAAVYYHSKALERDRRMHVYTPPGYELGKDKYPVFYLLHGAGDCDESWTSVGRAGFIIDNLIAAKKAKPMIVVMPAGHTSQSFRMGGAGGRDEFAEDFMQDIMPYVEKHYRVLPGRANRAMAGLSMGGGQTLNIGMAHLDQFAYLGVFSSGVLNMGGPRPANGGPAPQPGPTPEWLEQRKQMLDNASLKKGLKLLWFKTGVDDFLLPTTNPHFSPVSPRGKWQPAGHLTELVIDDNLRTKSVSGAACQQGSRETVEDVGEQKSREHSVNSEA